MNRLQTLIERKQIFIDGKWVDSSSDGVITVINPATEEPIATVPNALAEEVYRAVRAAANAFESWSRSTLEERTEVLAELMRLIDARRDEITETIVSEVGQPWSEAARRQVASPIKDLEAIVDGLREI